MSEQTDLQLENEALRKKITALETQLKQLNVLETRVNQDKIPPIPGNELSILDAVKPDFEFLLEGFAFCRLNAKENQANDFVFLKVNQEFETLTGLKNVIGKNASEVIPNISVTHPEISDICNRVAQSGKPETFETDLNSLGNRLSVSIYSPERDFFIAFIINKSDQNRNEDPLHLNDEKYRFLIENLTETVWLMDMDFKLIYSSPSVITQRGYTPEEIIRIPLQEQLSPDSYQKAMDLFLSAVSPKILAEKNNTVFEDIQLELIKKDGSYFWSENNFILIPDALGYPYLILCTTKNNSTLKSEERFQALVEQAADSFFMHDFEGRFVEVNRQACESLGYSREQLLQMAVFDVEQDFDLEKAQTAWKQIKPGQTLTLLGHQRKSDGTVFPVEAHLGSCEVQGERYILGLVRDITDRIQAEESIRKNEEKLRIISENSGDVIWIADINSQHFSYISPSVFQLRGFTPEEVMKEPISMSFSPESKKLISEELPNRIQALMNGDESVRVQTNQVGQIHKNGQIVPTEVVTTLVTDQTGRVTEIIGVARNITEREQSEEKLNLQIQHLSAP